MDLLSKRDRTRVSTLGGKAFLEKYGPDKYREMSLKGHRKRRRLARAAALAKINQRKSK